jgi:hypothetical protein
VNLTLLSVTFQEVCFYAQTNDASRHVTVQVLSKSGRLIEPA